MNGRITSVRMYSRKTTYEIQDTDREGRGGSSYKWSHPTTFEWRNGDDPTYATIYAMVRFRPGDRVTFETDGYYKITEPKLCVQ